MNISKIIDMIKEDASQVSDVAKFLGLMNDKNIEQVVKSREVVVEETKLFSFADLNGGPATETDVKIALDTISQEPLQAEAAARLEKLKAAIAAGEVTDVADLTAKFEEVKS